MNPETLWVQVQDVAVRYGLKIIGALVLWIVGRWVIGFITGMIRRALSAKHLDATLQQYVGSIVGVGLNILLVIAILAQFGVETTSFAAVIAAAGLAIGMAWGGLLANFAAGAFLLVLRPFKVGDLITAAGVTGVVNEIGLFATTLTTPDGVRTFIGNNKIFSDTIQNLSDTAHRRVELRMQLAHGVDIDDTIRRVRERLLQTPGVLAEPAPEVWVLEFTMAGAVLAVRPYCKSADYWSVYGATNDVIRAVSAEAKLPAPELRYAMRTNIEE